MANVQTAVMNTANIPPFARRTTLPREMLGSFRTLISGREYASEFGLVNYRFNATDGRRAAHVTAVFAKELALAGQKTLFLPFGSLLHEVRHLDYRSEVSTPHDLPARLGQGYIVIPDLTEALRGRGEFPVDESFAILSTHCSRGGALVLGVGPEWKHDNPTVPPSFATLLSDFTGFSV